MRGAERVDFPRRWLTPIDFEGVVSRQAFGVHLRRGGTVVVSFPEGARVPAGLGLWLLSFLNQLADRGAGHIHLEFAEVAGLFGYMDRSGFLQLLSDNITTEPERPAISTAEAHRGEAIGLVEIAELRRGVGVRERQGVIGAVVDKLIGFYPSGREKTRRLQNHLFTVLGELVDNVFSHSRTRLPGYVSLQAYRKEERRPRIQVAVSDSGIGIPASIRETRGRVVAGLGDAQIVLEAFRQGLSRHGSAAGHGCGLTHCASLAARYGSTLYVRTPTAQVVLDPATGSRPYHNAQIIETVAELAGTHLYWDFRVA